MTDKSGWQEYDSGLRKYKNNYHILKDENVNKLPNTDHKIVPFRGISIFTLNDSDSSLIQKHDDFEIVAIKFKTHRNKTFVLILCYLSPSIKCKNIIDTFFEKIILHVNQTSLNEKVIILGDLNAKDNLLYPTNLQAFTSVCCHSRDQSSIGV